MTSRSRCACCGDVATLVTCRRRAGAESGALRRAAPPRPRGRVAPRGGGRSTAARVVRRRSRSPSSPCPSSCSTTSPQGQTSAEADRDRRAARPPSSTDARAADDAGRRAGHRRHARHHRAADHGAAHHGAAHHRAAHHGAARPPPPPTTAPPTTAPPTTAPPTTAAARRPAVGQRRRGHHPAGLRRRSGDQAVAVARCESGLNPAAYSPAGLLRPLPAQPQPRRRLPGGHRPLLRRGVGRGRPQLAVRPLPLRPVAAGRPGAAAASSS